MDSEPQAGIAGGGTGGVLLGAFYLWPLLTQPLLPTRKWGAGSTRLSKYLLPCSTQVPGTRTDPCETGRHELRAVLFLLSSLCRALCHSHKEKLTNAAAQRSRCGEEL